MELIADCRLSKGYVEVSQGWTWLEKGDRTELLARELIQQTVTECPLCTSFVGDGGKVLASGELLTI